MLLTLPVLLPLVTAITQHLMPQRPGMLRVVGFAGSVSVLLASLLLFSLVQRDGIQVLQVGAWPAPFGITLVADVFSAVMVVMVSVIGLAVAGSSFAGVDPRRVAADPTARRRRRDAHASEERLERDLDARTERADHPLTIERDDRDRPPRLAVLADEAAAAVVPVGNREVDRQDVHL